MGRILSAAVVLAFGCTKEPVEVAPPKPAPVLAAPTLDQLLDRELADSVGDELVNLGTRQVKVEAAGPVQVKPDAEKKFIELTLPVGTQVPVQCFLYPTPIDAGATIARAISQVKAKFALASVRLVAVEVVERSPALFVELKYLVDSSAGKKAGQLKLAVFPDTSSPVFCLHDEPGYPKSFQRIATRLASILARSAPESGPVTTYRTVSIDTLNGAPVGFETVRFTKTDDGVKHIATLSTLLLPRSANEWVAQDSATISDLDADGLISARRVVAVTNGELQLNMLVTHNGGRLYTYNGTSSGKELSGSFKTKNARGLESDVLFSPQLKIVATVDANGDSEATDLQLGPLTLHSARKFIEGSPE